MTAFLQELPRGHYRQVWEKATAGAELTQDETLLARAMRRHPEWAPFWSDPEHARPESPDRNPFLHVLVDCAVERQVEDGQPPEAREALHRLEKSGRTRDEAIHRIGDEFVRFFGEMYRSRSAFDPAAYGAALKRLA